MKSCGRLSGPLAWVRLVLLLLLSHSSPFPGPMRWHHPETDLRGAHSCSSNDTICDTTVPTILLLPLTAAAEAEASVLRGMKTQVRCCIATLGDGAAADAAVYDALWGSIIVWLGALLLLLRVGA